DRKRLPKQVAALGIKRSEPTPRAMVAARGGPQDCVLLRERRGTPPGETDFVLVEQPLVPYHLAGFLLSRDHSSIIAGDRDDQIIPQCNAAVAIGLSLARVHLPDDRAGGPGAHIDLRYDP